MSADKVETKKTFHLRAEWSLNTIIYSQGNTFPWAFSYPTEYNSAQNCLQQRQDDSCKYNPFTSASQLRQLPLTQGFTACVAGALPAVAVQRRELLVRLAEFADAAAGREARRFPPVGVASTRQPSLGIAVNIEILKQKKQITIVLVRSLASEMRLKEQTPHSSV